MFISAHRVSSHDSTPNEGFGGSGLPVFSQRILSVVISAHVSLLDCAPLKNFAEFAALSCISRLYSAIGLGETQGVEAPTVVGTALDFFVCAAIWRHSCR